MHGVRSGDPCGVDETIDVQVAVRGGTGPNRTGFISHSHMTRRAVAFGVHRHRGQSHVATGTDDTDGDLTAISDKNFAQS